MLKYELILSVLNYLFHNQKMPKGYFVFGVGKKVT